MTTTKKDESLFDQIMKHLTGGDKGKLSKFLKGVSKFTNEQVKAIETRIENTENDIEEKEEELIEYLLEPDFDQIQKNESRAAYIKRYVAGYDSKISEIEELKESVKDDKTLIEKRKALGEVVEKGVKK